MSTPYDIGRLMEPWVIALVSAIASGCATVVGSVYWFGRSNVTKEDLTKATEATSAEFRSLHAAIDSHERNVGETITGIRAKINEVEMYVRDTFVRRDSWHTAMNQLQERWSVGEKAAEDRAVRIEAKVDRIIERLMGSSGADRL